MVWAFCHLRFKQRARKLLRTTLGVKISDNPSPAEVEKLRQLQFDHEERLLELGIEKARIEQEELKALLAAQANQEDNVSKRWQADMASDSWMSKNIRPLTLVYILTAYLLFAGSERRRHRRQRSLCQLARPVGYVGDDRVLWRTHR
jgi:hypothetical protein